MPCLAAAPAPPPSSSPIPRQYPAGSHAGELERLRFPSFGSSILAILAGPWHRRFEEGPLGVVPIRVDDDEQTALAAALVLRD
ncbi:hypothetical protein CGMCC3_g12885 [Colletotrichum fructicola]|nr:uncharacterized protein CGMCC3_g12885 [Colletotrichum fructicola]KAE9571018.1 hypothetical protein CGMCC3_g12885 [Colletotrichum fructicola]